jgi:hypothetical protein
MTYARSSSFLRRVLIIDAVISGATGLMLIAGADLLHDWLAVPAELARGAGLSLIPFALLVGYLATRQSVPRAGVWAVIVLNALWAVDSILLLIGGFVSPTALGTAFIIAQALAVAVLAELEYVGLRRSAAVPA